MQSSRTRVYEVTDTRIRDISRRDRVRTRVKGAGAVAGAEVVVQRGDCDDMGVFGGDGGAGSAGDADVVQEVQELQKVQWETSRPIALRDELQCALISANLAGEH